MTLHRDPCRAARWAFVTAVAAAWSLAPLGPVHAAEPAVKPAVTSTRVATPVRHAVRAKKRVASGAIQREAAQKAVRAKAQRVNAGVPMPGMVVAIDPETGRLGMPTPAQLQALESKELDLNMSDVGLPVLHGPNGAIGIDLMGRYQDYSVIRIGKDGKKHVSCVQDQEAMQKALAPDEPSPAADVK